MGRKAFFSQQEVFTAADALVADGKEVTANALLSKLGGGSLTTIYKHLAEWRTANPAALNQAAPIEIPDLVQGAFAATWRTAMTEAGKEITAVREKAAEEIKAAQKQFQEALQSIERLESEADNDAVRIDELDKNVKSLDEAIRQCETERAALAATSEQQRQHIASMESELNRNRTELESARKDREALVKEAAELRGQVEALKDQNKGLLSRLSPNDKDKNK